jgi:membrane fusion protein (multidrug efflux system)
MAGARSRRGETQMSCRIVLLASLVLAPILCSATARAADPAPVAVSVVRAERQAIANSLEFVGRVEAPEKVDVRAQVKGILEAVLFKDGENVTQDTPLYLIDKSLFEAAVTQAEGDLQRSKASLALATVQRQRAEDLLAKNAGTVVARDQAVAVEEQSKGAVTAAEANLETAKINLGYTDIRSPITGRIGSTNVTKGNLVGPESGVLVTIVSENPMHITFPVSQRDYLAAQKSGLSGDLKSVEMRIKFADGSTYDQVGHINFVNVSVDRATDTLILRGDMPNPKGLLTDGQLVRVVLQSSTPKEQVVVPQAALISDQQGVYVFVVEDGKAAIKRVKTGGESGANIIVTSGLEGGEQVIVEGFQTLRPGVPVRATPFSGGVSGG